LRFRDLSIEIERYKYEIVSIQIWGGQIA